MPVAVPAVARIVVKDALRMVEHDLLVDLVPLCMQECHIEHIEEPPVLRHGVRAGIALQKCGDAVLLFFCIAVPDLFL